MKQYKVEITDKALADMEEILEIASDFGDPLKLFREALHNAYDWGATEFKLIMQ